ncbi:MAG: HD domain-containing protein [Holosporales bacterium]|jgi:putative nucleotidyltransferase with HDIG domain|nr:HD domain-containing protein [Holosporales bacterium]
MYTNDIRLLGHSGMVAKAAAEIAKITGLVDPVLAYKYGLFHDIGKFYLSHEKRYKHPLLGYTIMNDSGKPDIAKICLTHPFPVNDIEYITFYCHGDIVESQTIHKMLKEIEQDFAIKLIQFCDKISLEGSYVTLEQKFDWYVQKYGIKTDCVDKNYEQLFDIKKVIDSSIGEDVYKILGVQ